jgi:hypothetical protein
MNKMQKRGVVALVLLVILSLPFGARYIQDAAAQVTRATVVVPTTIATGNTFQTILAAGAKFSIEIVNNNATDSCWITYGTLSNGTKITAGNATTATAELLMPGGSFQRYSPSSTVPTDEFEATCATSADTLAVRFQ